MARWRNTLRSLEKRFGRVNRRRYTPLSNDVTFSRAVTGVNMASMFSQKNNMVHRKYRNPLSMSYRNSKASRTYHTRRNLHSAKMVFDTPSTNRTMRRASTHSVHGSDLFSRSSEAREEPRGIFVPSVKRGSTVVKQKRTMEAKVHPSKKFKAMVEKTLAAQEIHGTYKVLYTGLHIANVAIPSDEQYYVQGFSSLVATANPLTSNPCPTPWSFTTDQFLDAASILFNGLVPTNTAVALAAQNGTGKFNHQNVVLHVKSSSTHYLIKNQSLRVQVLRIYLCAPKAPFAYSPIDLNTEAALPVYTGGQNGVSEENPKSPLQCFDQAYIEDLAGGRILVQPSSYAPSTAACGLLVTPMDFPTFRNSYRTEYREVTLEPGQSWTYVVHGPRAFHLDFAKLQKGELTLNVQKYSRCPLIMIRNDLVTGNDGTNSFGTRIQSSNGANTTTGGVSVERTDHYALKMPDQTGGATSVTPVTVGNTLQKRKPYHVIAQFGYGTANTATAADRTPVVPGTYNA